MIQTQTIATNGQYLLGKANGVTQTLIIFGTWNGAKVDAYASADGVNYVPISNGFVADDTGALTKLKVPFTEDECRNLFLNPGISVMLLVSSAGASTQLIAQIV